MVGYIRKDVTFDSDGLMCRAWWYEPSQSASPLPCIVMAHGLGGTRNAALEPYADHFAQSGYAVLLFDYRHFGASDGEPRQIISVHKQLQDWAQAIAFARHHELIDPKKIALWGSSFSGGHVLVAAARDGEIAAISAQCPMMDGLAACWNVLKYAGPAALGKLTALGILDELGSLWGRAPIYVPLVAPPGKLAAMSSEDAYTGYFSLAPAEWRNEIAARLAPWLPAYRPINYARRLPCPALLQICDRDSVAPVSAALATAKKLGSLADVKHYDMGHFDIYVGDGFQQSSRDQLKFFNRVFHK